MIVYMSAENGRLLAKKLLFVKMKDLLFVIVISLIYFHADFKD